MPDDRPPITNQTYAEEMSTVIVAAHLMVDSRVDELLAIVEKSEALGPVLEPTAYQRGGAKRLHEQRRLLTACAEVVRVWREIEAENPQLVATPASSEPSLGRTDR